MNEALSKVVVSAGASLAVTESTGASESILKTALITLAISIVTQVGSEVVKFLVAFFKAKTKKYESEEEKDDKA